MLLQGSRMSQNWPFLVLRETGKYYFVLEIPEISRKIINYY